MKNGLNDVFYKIIHLGKSLKKRPIREGKKEKEKRIKKFLIYISVHPGF